MHDRHLLRVRVCFSSFYYAKRKCNILFWTNKISVFVSHLAFCSLPLGRPPSWFCTRIIVSSLALSSHGCHSKKQQQPENQICSGKATDVKRCRRKPC